MIRTTKTHPAAVLALSALLGMCTVMGPHATALAQEATGEISIQAQATNGKDKKMTHDMTLTIGKETFTATLEDNKTTEALRKHLPQEFTMEELNGNEKYKYLDFRLPANAKNPRRIEAGDIMLYGSDCLVVFYESFDTPYTYTRIGKISDTKGLKDALGKGSAKVRFELK